MKPVASIYGLLLALAHALAVPVNAQVEPVVITPSSQPTAVAAVLALRPVGERVILFRDFDFDLMSYDLQTVLLSTQKRPVKVPSATPTKGKQVVYKRVFRWITLLRSKGGAVDKVQVGLPNSAAIDLLQAKWIAGPRFVSTTGVLKGPPTGSAGGIPVPNAANTNEWKSMAIAALGNLSLITHRAAVAAVYPSATVNLEVVNTTSVDATSSALPVVPPPAVPPPVVPPPVVPPPVVPPPVVPPPVVPPPVVPPPVVPPPVVPPPVVPPPVVPALSPAAVQSITFAAAKASDALSAYEVRLTSDWSAPLTYPETVWPSIFEKAMESPSLRSRLIGWTSSCSVLENYGTGKFHRPETLAEIDPAILNPLHLQAGNNGEIYALSIADCSQAEFLRTSGVKLAIAAAYYNNADYLQRALEILREFVNHSPLQRPGWTAYTPTSIVPAGGDGVYLATGWGIQGIVEMLSILGDRVPVDLRNDLRDLLRKEVRQISSDWADKRPWYVKSKFYQSNQWIEPNLGLIRACLYLGDPELVPVYNLAVENIAKSIERLGSDGAFIEGISYASMTAGNLFEVIALTSANNDPRLQSLPYVRNAWKWFVHMQQPGGYYVNCNDSVMSRAPAWAVATPLPSLFYAALVSGDPQAMPFVKTMFPQGEVAKDAILYQAAISGLPGGSTDSLPKFAHFSSQQLLVWRSEWESPSAAQYAMSVWIRGGSPMDSHSHRDNGHVSIHSGDKVVLMECGTPDYSNPLFNAKFGSAAGHNTLQVGELTPRSAPANCPIVVESLTDSGGRVTINLKPAFPITTDCSRVIEWNMSGTVTVSDNVSLPTVSPVGTEFYRFHTGRTDGITITASENGWDITWPGVLMSISADRPIIVEQITWPDAVREPFIHQAIIVKCVGSESSLSLRTEIRVTR
jgi:hypothetical protein